MEVLARGDREEWEWEWEWEFASPSYRPQASILIKTSTPSLASSWLAQFTTSQIQARILG